MQNNVDTSSTLIKPEIEKKIDSLLSKMTLDEKVGQMTQYNGNWDVTGPLPEGDYFEERYEAIASGKVGSMLNIIGAEATLEAQKIAVEKSRLGIPLIFGYDVIHGYKTMFPIPLGDAASWDLEAIEKATRVAAMEASSAGIHWAFAPMMDVTRDPRWGRIMEGAGEDPFLASKISVARVKGFQGDNLSDLTTVAATAKHFAGYGFIRGGLDYNTTELSNTTLYNMVLPPFKASVDAGVASVMNSFNDINGIPATAHTQLQRDILKEEWGFDGLIISDWANISEMVTHGFAKDLVEATKKAILAGTDMDMESNAYEQHLVTLVNSGEVEEKYIDEAVRRILRIKFLLGLFDDPYRYSNALREKKNTYTESNRQIARDIAKKSIVLLKNDGKVLPISKSVKSIAVIGALANDKDTPLGSWRAQAQANSAVSLLEGIKNAVGNNTTVKFAQGYTLATNERAFINELDFSKMDNTDGFDVALKLARTSDVVVVAVGEEAFQSGEGRSQTSISLKGAQLQLLKKITAINDNVVVVLMNGRPIAEPWLYENSPAILETWHLGSEAGNAIADVIFGDNNPSGKLPISIPRNVGQIPIFYNHDRTGRPDAYADNPNMVFWSHYTDSEKTPQFYFGHGLSYTTFEYSKLNLSSSTMTQNDTILVSVDITNTGAVEGEEVVQLYLHDKFASIIRPVKELKGFKKINLIAGESKTIQFEITKELLSFYGPDGVLRIEPGEFEIMVGGNSQNNLSKVLTLEYF